MTEEESILIDLVQGFEHLYNKKHPLFEDKLAIENAWKTVASVRSQVILEKNLFLLCSILLTKENILNKKDELNKPSLVWETLIVDDDVILSSTETETSREIQSPSEDEIPQSPKYNDFTESDTIPNLSDNVAGPSPKKTSFELKVFNFRKEAHISKKKKPNETSNPLIDTCDKIGQSLTAFLEQGQSHKDIPNINQGDYHFAM
ncbi:unnamed protein product [Ceutorhynchus assimilis]|uniref:MADF domain-containing protein n=1 Tax=Ceutorhynchus assimilis TaxID=467358 RepID=A0A9N9MP27_9CUCU|nr:unnamed protein product [Ceutorhynchus assimilis]